MLMMTPLACRRMIGITCLAARMQLLRLIATQRSNASSVMSSSSASPPARLTPTLLCRMAMRPFRRMSFHSRHWVLLQYLFVSGLVVDLHRRQHAHHGTVEGDREHEIDHVLVGKFALDLGKSRLRHCKLAHHLARPSQDRF